MENNAQKDNQISPVNSKTKFAYLRLLMGFLLTILGMVLAFGLGVDDKTAAAAALATMLTGLIPVFVNGNQ